MRLAYFSPLNPTPSGISDYSEELLPHLAPFAEIELILTSTIPSNPALTEFPQRTLQEFKARAAEYDVNLYHIGNSPAHALIYETALEYPGVIVLHDVVLHHLRAWQTIERGNAVGYWNLLREAYGADVSEQARANASALNRFEYPLSEALVRCARGVIVHSEYAARFVQSTAPRVPVAIVPMGIAPMPLIEKRAARQQMQLSDDTFILSAFGEVQPQKRVTIVLEAFAEFLRDHPNALLILVGSESPNYDTAHIAQALGVENKVQRTGYVTMADYQTYIAASDVCLNLRYPSAGETSASLLRLLGAGKVTFVTRTAAYAELPDDVCVKIEPDAYEKQLLVEYFKFFDAQPHARTLLEQNAREHVTQYHTLERAAKGYADFLSGMTNKIS